MVKKKGSREINPADAHRKAQRAKEIARNKKERKFQRDAQSLQANPDAIKDELKDILALEEEGKGSQTVRLKRKALQGAYDHAVKKRKEEELKKVHPVDELAFSTEGGHGVLQRRPEDSVYYHPTINPSGVPPPGKPQRYKTSVANSASSLANLPKPKPPPLPAGPAPSSQAAPDSQAQSPKGPLPPPGGPPPSHVLPPPSGPPPGAEARNGNGALPPPSGPPPNFRPGFLPPPRGPPPGMIPMGPPGMMRPIMPPPSHPPPHFIMPPPAGPPPGIKPPAPPKEHKEAKPTIQASSTVVRVPRAEQDKTVTAMVPASLRLKKAQAQAKTSKARHMPSAAPKLQGEEDGDDLDFGNLSSAAPRLGETRIVNKPKGVFDSKYEDFMSEMNALGALES